MGKTVALFASAVLSFGLAACSGSRHEATEKYYLVVSNTKLPYWQAASAGLSRAAHGLGVATEMVGPDTYDPQAEAQAFRDAMAKKPSGILVSAADPNIMKRSGATYITAELADEYGVTDIDGRKIKSQREKRGAPLWKPISEVNYRGK